MKLLFRITLIMGIGFWGVLFSIHFATFFLLNGIGDIFNYQNPEIISMEVSTNSSYTKINYSFYSDSTIINEEYKMVNEYFYTNNLDTIIVKQNLEFPDVSYIEGLPLKQRQAKIGMIISCIFIVFFLILGYANGIKNLYKKYKNI
ncbi:hypothetical protein [Persicobacter diffluens]|uniref:Uncharacterized protein n=1 Tax=Persicobacter diffluens TaxID=981 RepID=A0AAN4VZJ1_9BACT|nr:hypothetical protein PEDI_35210 [Persicobacter diffluens]